MYTQLEKTKVKQSKAAANSFVQRKSVLKQGFDFVDNRPEAIAQRKLLGQANSNNANGKDKVQSASADTIQRVATNLIEGLDKDSPSTYDTGGGHSYADHGAHTTKEAHVIRVKTGVAPSGRNSPVPPGKASSKFASDDKHKQAFNEALTAIQGKNLPKQKVKGAGNVIEVAGAGTLYYEDETEEPTGKVQLDIQPVNDTTIRINSMYPVKG